MMRAEIGYKPSFLWRSLLAAKELVREGEAWRIGDGKMTCMQDRWIGVENQSRPQGELQMDNIGENISFLIDSQTGEWKEHVIRTHFQQDDVQRILSIPLSSGNIADHRIWRCTPHGFFTVKTAYHLAVAKFSRIHDERPSPSVIPMEWKKLWKIDVIPRVKMFLWKASTDALPTRSNLVRRGCTLDPICPLCGEEPESSDHLFLRCQPIQAVWYGSTLRMDVCKEKASSFRELLWNKINNFPNSYVELFAYVAWEIWKQRNGVCFEERNFDIQGVIQRSQSQWNENVDGRRSDECKVVESPRQEQWMKPNIGNYKLNSDAAVLGDGRLGMGFVVRDAIGGVCLAGKKEMRACGSSTLLEGLAMRFALQMTKQYRMQIDHVESDSKNLIAALNGKQKPDGYGDVIIRDIKELARECNCNGFHYTPRRCNQVAHHAAR